MRNTPQYLALLAAASLATVSSAHAGVLLSADFESGIGGWTAYSGASTAPGSVDNGPDATFGNALRWTAGTDNNAGVATTFAGTTLAIGDSLNLTLQFRFTASPPDPGSALLRIALGTDATTDAADSGLRVAYNTGSTGGSNMAFDIGPAGGMLGGTQTTVTPVGTQGAISSLNTNSHNLSFSITRSATGYDMSYALDSGTAVTGTYTSAANINFNKLVIGENSASLTNFAIDNVILTSVPEPSAALFGGLGLLGLLRRRRCA